MRPEYIVGNRKVAIIGAGFVGSSIAYALALRDIAREIALIDINREKCDGEAMDIRHGLPSMGTVNLYAGDYSDCEDCDLIVITAGRNRRSGESRLDMISENILIMKTVTDSIKEYYTRGCILIISNPVDILTYKVSGWMGLSNGMVFGTGCILDTSRLVRCVADYLRLSTGVINGYLIGEHGDGQIPIWSRMTVGGIPIGEYCDAVGVVWNEDVQNEIAKRTRAMGADIIKAKGRTHYGVATCVCYIADAIINQRSSIMSVTSPLMGEHGCRGVSLSVPSIVGTSGVQQRIREKWTPEEYRVFLTPWRKIEVFCKSYKMFNI